MYLCGRTTAKAAAAIERIKEIYPKAHITPLEMNHLSLDSVAAASKQFLAQEDALHGLVNNAGIMATPLETTENGYEAQWQTNYLAHWVFTYSLIPLLLKTSQILPPGSVRIVNLSSSGHYSAPKCGINFDDLSLPGRSSMERYGQSKLANILHAKRLHRLYGPDSAHASSGKGEIWTAIVHPGLVESRLGEHAVEIPWLMKKLFNLYGAAGGRIDGDRGSWTSVFCVASPDFQRQQSGTYFQRIAEPGWTSGKAKDGDLAARLEDWTMDRMRKDGWVQ